MDIITKVERKSKPTTAVVGQTEPGASHHLLKEKTRERTMRAAGIFCSSLLVALGFTNLIQHIWAFNL